jgi:hypothetical protein
MLQTLVGHRLYHGWGYQQIDRCILNNEEEALIKFHGKWELAVEGNGSGNGLRMNCQLVINFRFF